MHIFLSCRLFGIWSNSSPFLFIGWVGPELSVVVSLRASYPSWQLFPLSERSIRRIICHVAVLESFSVFSVSVTVGIPQLWAQVTSAQSSVNFGSVAVGALDRQHRDSVIHWCLPASRWEPPSVVTQGRAESRLHRRRAGTTCGNGTTATTCTVQVQFLPIAPGTRSGGVVLSDQSGCVTRSSRSRSLVLASARWWPSVRATMTTIVGICCSAWYGGDGGSAAQAQISYPYGIGVDAAGNIYIGDTGNNRVRKINLKAGIIATIAGNGKGLTTVATAAWLQPKIANSPNNFLIRVDGPGQYLHLGPWVQRVSA